MKNIYKIALLLVFVFTSSCTQENYEFGEIIAPSNIKITPEIVGVDASHPYGDGSGVVHMKASADNAITYKYIYNGVEQMAPSGNLTYNFGNTGVHKYTITVIANGTGGVSSSSTFEVEVLVVYAPPADLITMLTANSSRTWRIKAEGPGHLGNSPADVLLGPSWYSALPNDKANWECYDDRFVFNKNGDFQHKTNGKTFGKLTAMAADFGGNQGRTGDAYDDSIFDLADYTDKWSISAPGGKETLSFSGLGYPGYYVGGNHKYTILSRTSNEMSLRTIGADGNAWYVILIAE